ncbi:MAG: hypothetical protein JXB62_06270 [Pirellulales bacterium]|nr:hypothetical protein [Pirellulales bacterium]
MRKRNPFGTRPLASSDNVASAPNGDPQGAFDNSNAGELIVRLDDWQVPLDQELAADAIVAVPQWLAEDDAQPGTSTNRGENGFYAGRYIQRSPNANDWAEVRIYVHDPNGDLAGQNVQLLFPDDDKTIKIWDSRETPTQIFTGHTFSADEGPYTVYVEGYQDGDTEITVSLVGGNEQRPLSDVLYVLVGP